MPSTKELRRRIKSVKNTSQITKAMQMVSATKMRRAQGQALSGRPYSSTLLGALSLASRKIDPNSHVLLQPNGSTQVGVIMLSTDKGLCGALNANLIRVVSSEFVVRGQGKEIVFYTIGKKGRDFLVRTGKNLIADLENKEHVDFRQAAVLRKMAIDVFLAGEVGEVYLLYPHFISTLRQEPRLRKILPIDSSLLSEVGETESVKTSAESFQSEFLFEPGADVVLDYALTHLVEVMIYQALLETKASEHSARMIAMQNATDNAKELVEDLTLTYNQMRQSAVTTELLEITSAGAALE